MRKKQIFRHPRDRRGMQNCVMTYYRPKNNNNKTTSTTKTRTTTKPRGYVWILIWGDLVFCVRDDDDDDDEDDDDDNNNNNNNNNKLESNLQKETKEQP